MLVVVGFQYCTIMSTAPACAPPPTPTTSSHYTGRTALIMALNYRGGIRNVGCMLPYILFLPPPSICTDVLQCRSPEASCPRSCALHRARRHRRARVCVCVAPTHSPASIYLCAASFPFMDGQASAPSYSTATVFLLRLLREVCLTLYYIESFTLEQQSTPSSRFCSISWQLFLLGSCVSVIASTNFSVWFILLLLATSVPVLHTLWQIPCRMLNPCRTRAHNSCRSLTFRIHARVFATELMQLPLIDPSAAQSMTVTILLPLLFRFANWSTQFPPGFSSISRDTRFLS